MQYLHSKISGERYNLPVGKVVCVGRNYVAHARELNNPVPSEPVLFMKPSTALVPLARPIVMPVGKGSCHFETEISLLIGKTLSHADEAECRQAITGVGLGLDLTLRELQSSLKQQALPWEKAKAFDGSCPLSAFVPVEELSDLCNISFELRQNGDLQQIGNSNAMITPILGLLEHISEHFTLLPGDVVLTGTPAGVGPLNEGDRLELALSHHLVVDTRVEGNHA